MKINLEHFKRISSLGNYDSTNKTVTPFRIREGYEYIEIVTGGKVIWTNANGEEQICGIGTIFWHQAGDFTISKSVKNEPYRCFYINIQVDNSPRFCPKIGEWNATFDLNLFLDDFIESFYDKSIPKDFLKIYIITNLLKQQFHSIRKNNILPINLQNACQLINKNYTGDLSIEYIAKHVGVSRTQLFRLFETHMHISPFQYLLNQRLTQAKSLLLTHNKDLPIKVVADMCGFNNIEVFYRNFKKQYKLAPHEFRLKNHKS